MLCRQPKAFSCCQVPLKMWRTQRGLANTLRKHVKTTTGGKHTHLQLEQTQKLWNAFFWIQTCDLKNPGGLVKYDSDQDSPRYAVWLCNGFSFSFRSSGCILGSINLGVSQKCGSPFPILHPKCWILVGKQTSFSYVPPNFETLLSQLASSSHHLDRIFF